MCHYERHSDEMIKAIKESQIRLNESIRQMMSENLAQRELMNKWKLSNKIHDLRRSQEIPFQMAVAQAKNEYNQNTMLKARIMRNKP